MIILMTLISGVVSRIDTFDKSILKVKEMLTRDSGNKVSVSRLDDLSRAPYQEKGQQKKLEDLLKSFDCHGLGSCGVKFDFHHDERRACTGEEECASVYKGATVVKEFIPGLAKAKGLKPNKLHTEHKGVYLEARTGQKFADIAESADGKGDYATGNLDVAFMYGLNGFGDPSSKSYQARMNEESIGAIWEGVEDMDNTADLVWVFVAEVAVSTRNLKYFKTDYYGGEQCNNPSLVGMENVIECIVTLSRTDRDVSRNRITIESDGIQRLTGLYMFVLSKEQAHIISKNVTHKSLMVDPHAAFRNEVKSRVMHWKQPAWCSKAETDLAGPIASAARMARNSFQSVFSIKNVGSVIAKTLNENAYAKQIQRNTDWIVNKARIWEAEEGASTDTDGSESEGESESTRF